MRVKVFRQAGTSKKRGYAHVIMPVALGFTLALFLVGSATGAGVTMRVSTDSSGTQASGASYYSAMSADGRYVVFESTASDLVPSDANGVMDIYKKDTITGTTTRVSLTTSGGESNGLSHTPNLSANGRWVTFTSSADNLVPSDTNGATDIFVRDTLLNTTTRISTSSTGTQGNYASDYSSISADGRYVAFRSYASNLVTGDTNWAHDVFVKDTFSGATTRVSTSSSGVQGNDVSLDDVAQFPAISNDGRYVAFHSWASNLVAGDSNGVADVFVKDTQTGTTTMASTDSSGTQGNAVSYSYSISANGRYVAFWSAASNLITGDSNGTSDVFVKDRQTGATTVVSSDASGEEGYGGSSYLGSLSADGKYVSFNSMATTLVSGDTNSASDVFVKNTGTNAITRVSLNASAVEGNDASTQDALSADRRFASFRSIATNLVTGDTNSYDDIFKADTSMACTAGQPNLALSLTDAYWASYADYLARDLSLDLEVTNEGADAAYIVQVTGSTATNGVTCLNCSASATPLLGNLVGSNPGPAAAHGLTLKYDVPPSVGDFTATVSATAQDGCGTVYTYP